MPPKQKAPAKAARAKTASAKAPAGERAHALFKENERVIRRIASSLEAAQADLGKLRGSLGTGAGDLHRDLSRLLRDARRNAAKIASATRKDLERLQRDLLAAAKAKPKAAAARKPKAAAAKPKAAGAAKPKATRAAKPKAARAAKPKAAVKPKATRAAKPKAAAGSSRGAGASRAR